MRQPVGHGCRVRREVVPSVRWCHHCAEGCARKRAGPPPFPQPNEVQDRVGPLFLSGHRDCLFADRQAADGVAWHVPDTADPAAHRAPLPRVPADTLPSRRSAGSARRARKTAISKIMAVVVRLANVGSLTRPPGHPAAALRDGSGRATAVARLNCWSPVEGNPPRPWAALESAPGRLGHGPLLVLRPRETAPPPPGRSRCSFLEMCSLRVVRSKSCKLLC